MASISSPVRSIVGSPRTSPTSSQLGAAQMELTPRSKIKAMLAAIDEDSDLDVPRKGQSNAENNRKSSQSPIEEVDGFESGAGKRNVRRRPGPFESESEDDAGNDVSVPRGKMAARLRQQRAQSEDGSSSSNDRIQGTSYDRIKQQLLRTKKDVKDSPAASTLQGENSKVAPTETVTREVLPSQLSGSPPQRRRSVTPNPHTPIKGKQSPDLFLTPEGHFTNIKPGLSTQRDEGTSEPESDDLPRDLLANSRFQELVSKKREERLAKEAAEMNNLAERKAMTLSKPKSNAQSRHLLGESDLDNDDEDVTSEKLTQQSRPARKASKKALEEMNRETQRMSRNMQLAHQARTKKKISKDSLLARFNFPGADTPATHPVSSSTVTSSAQPSDAEGARDQQTPPSSPAPARSWSDKPTGQKSPAVGNATSTASADSRQHQLPHWNLEDSLTVNVDADHELPDLDQAILHSLQTKDKGKGRAVEEGNEGHQMAKLNKTTRRIRLPRTQARLDGLDIDSDSDLEIVTTQNPTHRKLDVFDRLPARKQIEGQSLQALRALAHLTSPDKSSGRNKTSMTLPEMQASLQRRARQQAAKERAEKIQQLRDRGVVIQTAEEREKDQAVVEDLLEKARRENEEISLREKEASKKKRAENGEPAAADDSSDADEDYKDDGVEEDQAENASVEDEELGDDEDEEDSELESESGDDDEGLAVGDEDRLRELIDDEVSVDDDDDGGDGKPEDNESGPEEDIVNQAAAEKSRRRAHVVLDDEDEEDEKEAPNTSAKIKSVATEIIENPFIPAFNVPDEAPMGLTQAFAATMADSQTQCLRSLQDHDDEDPRVFLRDLPPPQSPINVHEDIQLDVEDSQSISPHVDSQEVDLHRSQSQTYHESYIADQQQSAMTQVSDIPDPTQDIGFALSSPIADRFVDVPPSTIDTVIIPQDLSPKSTPTKKKGKLRRRIEAVTVYSDEEVVANLATYEAISKTSNMSNVFEKMKKAVKKSAAAEVFDKKRSEAKGMVEEQAEESEDEYAGLGGASDEDSAAEDDEEVRKMIEEGDVKVDERELARFYADKERADDEKNVETLFKAINNGTFRRKRGADFDLSDSDDDVEARRRMKRQEFAKMRKALLENENVGKIAEDPKKLAFLRAIEDREDEEDVGFLDQNEEISQAPSADTQEVAECQQEPIVAAQLNSTIGKRKRPLQESTPDTANRPPPRARRTTQAKKPSTLAEIRQSVSFLIDEPDAMIQQPKQSSDDEEAPHSAAAAEDEDDNDDFSQDRESPRPQLTLTSERRSTNPFIDRLSLKRASSTLSSNSISLTTGQLAFHAPTPEDTIPGFRVPSLLRRATTSQLLAAENNNNHGITTMANHSVSAVAVSGTERAAGGGEKGDFIRRGGTKRSSVSYLRRSSTSSGGEKDERGGRRRRVNGALGGVGALIRLGSGSFD